MRVRFIDMDDNNNNIIMDERVVRACTSLLCMPTLHKAHLVHYGWNSRSAAS